MMNDETAPPEADPTPEPETEPDEPWARHRPDDDVESEGGET
jgi:hypothetical protein